MLWRPQRIYLRFCWFRDIIAGTALHCIRDDLQHLWYRRWNGTCYLSKTNQSLMREIKISAAWTQPLHFVVMLTLLLWRCQSDGRHWLWSTWCCHKIVIKCMSIYCLCIGGIQNTKYLREINVFDKNNDNCSKLVNPTHFVKNFMLKN